MPIAAISFGETLRIGRSTVLRNTSSSAFCVRATGGHELQGRLGARREDIVPYVVGNHSNEKAAACSGIAVICSYTDASLACVSRGNHVAAGSTRLASRWPSSK